MNSNLRVNLSTAPKYDSVKIEELTDYLTLHGLRVVRSYWANGQPMLIVQPISMDISHAQSRPTAFQPGAKTENRP
jgi:hypothetical protein